MKRLYPHLVVRLGILLLVVSLGLLQHALAADAVSDPVITNSSAETNDGVNPTNWHSNKWGINTASFQYLTTGHTGNHSVRTEVTNYTDGDAKWYFDPATVAPGAEYAFSDYYRSNTPTEVIVRFTMPGGGFTYAWLGTAASSPNWTMTSYNFTVPAEVTEATVFHVVASVGWLELDDVAFKAVPPPTTGGNLVANPSVENPANPPTMPEKWHSNSWGANSATFAYKTEGHTGSRSVRADITAYTDGDAKWYFDPVPVSAGVSYQFKDWYKASVPTQIIVRYTHNDGSYSYEWLGNALASTTWREIALSFTPPAGTKEVTVFHILNSVGWLELDDSSVSVSPPANPVPNPSLEEVSLDNSNKPKQWTTDHWGTNTASFTYPNNGHTGTKSVKVKVSNYTDGDAKWYFDPQPLTPGAYYRFKAWYKTNTTPHISIHYLNKDGSDDYINMPEPTPSGSTTEWQEYNDTFKVPDKANLASVFFYVNTNGWVQTDDYLIEPYEPTGFNRPLVTLTFDDGEEDNATTALPVLNAHGFTSTQCFATDHIENDPNNQSRVLAFRDSGHEICSHTRTHPFLTQVSAAQLTDELANSQQYLQNLTGKPVRNFASPYGDYNTAVLNKIGQYYRSHRTVDEGFNSKDNLAPMRLRVQNMLSTTTVSELQSWLNYAKETNTWLILVYHRIAPSDPGPFDTPVAQFVPQMDALQASGVTVKSMDAALDEVTSQP